MEIRAERDALTAERAELVALLADGGAQWGRIAEELRAVRKAFGKDAAGGARRTTFDDAPEVEEVSFEAMIEREPVTVVSSEMGWIRAMKGHLAPDAEIKFKDGDKPRFFLHAETTDRLLLFASNGRMFTLACAGLPGGRGMGEPVRLMIDLPNEAQMLALFVHVPGGRLLVASEAGDGFILPEDEAVAQTRAGRQILNLREGVRAAVCRPVQGDHVAVIGRNRKLLVFPRAELPEMGRGKGVRLQRYKDADGRLDDAITFDLADGLSWKDPAGRTRTVTSADLAEWVGSRASAGRMAPRGFPRENRFG
jgi:topoisomerase-4 subunit A